MLNLDKLKIHTLILIGFALTLPSFFRMIQQGIYSMQDFHYFRLVEFSKCITDLQIPCRWAPDSGMGYGEPLFNFYTQIAYIPGEIFHLLGFSYIDSLKVLFIFTLIGSFFSMFLLARQVWQNNASAMLASALYLYAPYRAVDVWVRAALPEAISFVLFPLIIYELNLYFEKRKLTNLSLLSFLIFLLITTHNLSVVLFSIVLLPLIVYRFSQVKQLRFLVEIVGSFIFALLLSSFYLFPVIFEAKYIDLQAITKGYFDYRGHFAALYQLLLSRFWGYGGSVFGPEDGLSLSVGQLQWIIPLLVLPFIILFKRKVPTQFFIFLVLGWVSLFFTHNKSTVIWEHFTFMSYLQFPWRFLGIAVFCFSLASGVWPIIFKKYATFLTVGLIILTVLINFRFFHEDIWNKVGDYEMLTGSMWDLQRSASLGDYWSGKALPQGIAPDNMPGIQLVKKKSNSVVYEITDNKQELYTFPVAYFPGWIAIGISKENYVLGQSDELGLITIKGPIKNSKHIALEFKNTLARTIGNSITIFCLVMLGAYGLRKKFLKNYE